MVRGGWWGGMDRSLIGGIREHAAVLSTPSVAHGGGTLWSFFFFFKTAAINTETSREKGMKS